MSTTEKTVHVLVVDDHPTVRSGVRRLLESDPRIQVVGEASQGEEALAQLALHPTDVVLLDIKLPGMDGVETTRQIRAKHPEAKVIILSAFGSEYIGQAIEAGANGYLLKTSPPAELARAVHEVAQGHSPLDPTLTPGLLDRFADLSKRSHHQGPTPRQHAILRLVASGMPSKQIAAHLAISDATLKREMRAIFDYLKVNDRAHAVAEGYRRNLL